MYNCCKVSVTVTVLYKINIIYEHWQEARASQRKYQKKTFAFFNNNIKFNNENMLIITLGSWG